MVYIQNGILYSHELNPTSPRKIKESNWRSSCELSQSQKGKCCILSSVLLRIYRKPFIYDMQVEMMLSRELKRTNDSRKWKGRVYNMRGNIGIIKYTFIKPFKIINPLSRAERLLQRAQCKQVLSSLKESLWNKFTVSYYRIIAILWFRDVLRSFLLLLKKSGQKRLHIFSRKGIVMHILSCWLLVFINLILSFY